MSMSHDNISRTREYVLRSAIPEERKDSLGNMLDVAQHAANGAPDKIQAMSDAIAALICHAARAEVRLPDAIDDAAKRAVSNHAAACPLRSGLRGKWAILDRFKWSLVVLVAVLAWSNFTGPAVARWIDKHGVALVADVARSTATVRQ